MLDRPHFSDCQAEYVVESDPVGQAIAALSSAAEHFKDLVVLDNPERSKNLDRMANQIDFEIICHALLQVQMAASVVECRKIANAAMGS